MDRKSGIRFICLWLSIALLIAGICIDVDHANSVFACDYVSDSPEAILSMTSLPSPEDGCTPEILGQRTNISFLYKHEEKTGRHVSVPQLFSVTEENFSTGNAFAGYFYLHNSISYRQSSTIIIHYIHIKDGQKGSTSVSL